MSAGWVSNAFRTRNIESFKTGDGEVETSLARRLGLFDLTALGVGSTLGAGIYLRINKSNQQQAVITGVVANATAGPAIVVSFAIAGLASVFAGLCYAEFGSRVPAAGSAYVYSYVTVGELIAWITGWNLILEYVIGGASVARAWSGYFDSLVGGAVSHFEQTTLGGWTVPGLGSYPDFFALLITLLLTMLVAVGVQESTRFNNVLTSINVCVVSFVIIAGLFFISFGNWSNFVPYGFGGIFTGAATCFYAYVGFDVIATSAEETKNPRRNIPLGIVLSLALCCFAYIGVSAIVTLMQNYKEIDSTAPLADAFKYHGVKWASIVISVGALCGLSTSLMTSIFPLPRIVYAIASDGLLFQWFGAVNSRFKTPLNATIVCGTFAGLMAFIFDIDALADMMSIGTLMSYTLVAACVMLLRYRPNAGIAVPKTYEHEGHVPLLDAAGHHIPTADEIAHQASRKSTNYLLIFSAASTVFAAVMRAAAAEVSRGEWWAITLIVISLLIVLVCTVLIGMLPIQSAEQLSFKAPFVPYLPLMSVFINIYLLVSLNVWTWVRFGVWLIIGLGIYFGWGMKHSIATGSSIPKH